MEKKPSDSNSQILFEKFSDCPFISTFRSLRRTSHRPQDAALSANSSSTPPTTSVGSGAVVHVTQAKTFPGKNAHPSNKFQYTDSPEKKKVVEVVSGKPDSPLQPLPSKKEKDKLFPVHIPIQNGQVGAKVAPKTEPEPTHFLAQQKEKPKNKAEVAPVAEAVMGSGQGKIVRESEPPQETTGKVKELKRTGTEIMNDKFSDYITRTKLKIKNMSSFSGGKGASFK